MSANAPESKPSWKDRREYYRVTVTIPLCIQPESATTPAPLTTQSINLSGGGFGLIVDRTYQPEELLSLTLLITKQEIFQAVAEVLRVEPLTARKGAYRLHARFVKLSPQKRDQLVRHITQFQRDHLTKHYNA